VIDAVEETVLLLARVAKPNLAAPCDVTLSIVADRDGANALARYWSWIGAQAAQSGAGSHD
jgi:hypothetical protein